MNDKAREREWINSLPSLDESQIRESRRRGARQANLLRPTGPRASREKSRKAAEGLRLDGYVSLQEIVDGLDATCIELISVALAILPVVYLHPKTARIFEVAPGNVDELPANKDALSCCWVRVTGNAKWREWTKLVRDSEPISPPKTSRPTLRRARKMCLSLRPRQSCELSGAELSASPSRPTSGKADFILQIPAYRW